MSFLNKLFSFFHGGNSASDTSTDPAYAHMPDNIFRLFPKFGRVRVFEGYQRVFERAQETLTFW